MKINPVLITAFATKKPLLIYLHNADAVCGPIVDLDQASGRIVVDNQHKLVPPTAINPQLLPEGRQHIAIRSIMAIGLM